MKKQLIFSGTSYLGINQNQAFRALLIEGLEKYGNNYGGSRLSNLVAPIFEEAEMQLSQELGAEAALSLSSGSLAGQLVVRYLEAAGMQLHFAPGTHPALWGRGQYYEGDFTDWVQQMSELAEKTKEEICLFANAVDPLYVQQFDFSDLKFFPQKRKTTIVIDDSHGIGVLGKNGSGIWASLPKGEHLRFIVVSSLGKALGIPGGAIFSDQETIKQLWQSPFFGGASPCLPAYLYAYVHSEKIYQEARIKLQNNIQTFNGKVEQKWFRSLPNYPVYYTTENQLAPFLMQRYILISSFPYPSPKDKFITRVVLNSAHSTQNIQQLTNLIHEFFQKP